MSCVATVGMRKFIFVESHQPPLSNRSLAYPESARACDSMWRYRLRVRTWPSQGQNPGSNPGIATNTRWLYSLSPVQFHFAIDHICHVAPIRKELHHLFAGTRQLRPP